jgi:proteasome accessory factor A
MRSGKTISAIDLQRRYLDAAKKYLHRRDAQTDMVLREWERTLDDLERDPLSTADRLDWSAKRVLYSQFIAENGVGWHDDILQSLDLEYHNVNPKTGLFYGLEEAGAMCRLVTDAEVEEATTTPPENTRALGRGQIVSHLIARPNTRYVIDWDAVYIERNRQLDLKNPFHTYEKEVVRFLRGIG